MLSTFEKTKTHEERRAAIQRQMEAMETIGSKRNITIKSGNTAGKQEDKDNNKFSNKFSKPLGSLENARRFLWDEDEEEVAEPMRYKVSRNKHKSTTSCSRRNLYSTSSYRDYSKDSSIFTSLGDLLRENPTNEEIMNKNSSKTSCLGQFCRCTGENILRLTVTITSFCDWIVKKWRVGKFCTLLVVVLIIVIPVVLFATNPAAPKSQNTLDSEMALVNIPNFHGSNRYKLISQRIFDSGITSKDVLEQIGTPQRMAFDWIVTNDPAQLDPDDKYILARYSLAVFYYSTHGKEMIFQSEDANDGESNFNFISEPNKVKIPDGILDEEEVITIGGELAAQPNWLNERGWLSGSGYCSWWGIKCSHRDGTPIDDTVYNGNNGIIILNMTENNMRGKLPIELFLANPDLRGLAISGNGFFGTVPKEIGTLTQMRYLALANNFLTGTLPETIVKMTNIDRLYLDRNLLSGTFLDIGLMTNLESLSIYDNKFTGSIPASIGNLIHLTALYMDRNNFDGSIPTSFSNLKKMEDLRLCQNHLVGSIPESFGNMSSLKILYLDQNNITGIIPQSLGNIYSFREIHLNKNQLEGSIPTEIGMLKKLVSLYLDNNNLSGTIPTEISKLETLEQIYLHRNTLEGGIPSHFSSMKNLVDLHLYSNLLTGSIPPDIVRAEKLNTLFLQENKLTGPVPEALDKLSNLKKLLFYSNNITGTLSQDICDLNLEELKSDCAGKNPKFVCSCCTICV